MINKSLARAIADGRFEETELGLFVPSERSLVAGRFCYGKRGEELEYSDNLVVTEGLNYIVGVALKSVTQITTWFIAPFSGAVTVQATWTAANFTTNSTEVTGYASATRPAWTGGSVTAGAVNSFAAKAEIKATSTITIRGAGMLSASAKSATTGTLLGASRFGSDKVLDTDEILDIGYGLTITAVT
jgi:hypothetical protein